MSRDEYEDTCRLQIALTKVPTPEYDHWVRSMSVDLSKMDPMVSPFSSLEVCAMPHSLRFILCQLELVSARYTPKFIGRESGQCSKLQTASPLHVYVCLHLDAFLHGSQIFQSFLFFAVFFFEDLERLPAITSAY